MVRRWQRWIWLTKTAVWQLEENRFDERIRQPIYLVVGGEYQYHARPHLLVPELSATGLRSAAIPEGLQILAY